MTVTCDLCNNADILAVSEYLDGYDRLCSTHEAGVFEQAPIQSLFDRLCTSSTGLEVRITREYLAKLTVIALTCRREDAGDRLCEQWQIDLTAVPVSPGDDHGE